MSTFFKAFTRTGFLLYDTGVIVISCKLEKVFYVVFCIVHAVVFMFKC